VDRESAYERLAAKLAPAPAAPVAAPAPTAASAPAAPQADHDNVVSEALKNPVVKSFAVAAAATLGREIFRGMFGTASKSRKR
jgi:hypothetical protein